MGRSRINGCVPGMLPLQSLLFPSIRITAAEFSLLLLTFRNRIPFDGTLVQTQNGICNSILYVINC